ncbi:MAG: SbcC/MukB-like Walker B domain-containing protein, partial [Acidimicrobiales bacterium]
GAAARFASIERALAAAGLAPGGRPFRDVVVDARSAAAAELARVEADLALAERLRREEAELADAERVAAALGRHLGSNAFQKWVLDEALGRLVSAATALLFELSGGAYSLTLEPRSSNFAVVDHVNGDARRSARTLSGGETFLASLALALALADQVVELAAGPSVRLESIFLDEGFGALDPETLDAVAAAIEELGARGRVVGLVSHVRELAERLPVRFEVRKLGGASTVTRVG